MVLPYDDETLISLLSRAARPSRLGWATFLRKVTGVSFRNARLAERRTFDFRRLGASLGLDPARLEQMSERALFSSDLSDDQILYFAPRELPWLKAVGYLAYNPAQLRAKQYIRQRWLQPDALHDAESGTLNLFHCSACGESLAKHATPMALPICGACGRRLDHGPRIETPRTILAFYTELRAEFGTSLDARPIQPRRPEVLKFSLGWRVAEIYENEPQLNAQATHFAREAGVGELIAKEERPRTGDVASAAVRRAQLLAAGLYVATHFDTIAVLHATHYKSAGRLETVDAAITNALLAFEDAATPSLI